jgi:threonine/homoserine/homoserine lactone efflux protein
VKSTQLQFKKSAQICENNPNPHKSVKTFLQSLSISFSGSLPMGIMNMAALQVSISQGVDHAIAFALAAIGMEGIIMFGTGRLSDTIANDPRLIRWLNRVGAALLFMIGCLFCYKVWAMDEVAKTTQSIDLPGWQYGIWLRLLNPTAILFWLGIHLALTGQKAVKHSKSHLLKFAAGGMTGTLGAYSVYIFLAHQLEGFLRPWSNFINLLLGILCLLAAFYKWRERN